MEGKAATLSKEALQHLTVAFAGTDFREFFSLLVTFFGKGINIDLVSFIDAAPVIKRPLDLTDTESESEDAASTSTAATVEPSTSVRAHPTPSEAPPVKKSVKIKLKATYQDKCGDVQEAIGFLPENPGSLHNTGTPDQFTVRRVGKNDHGTSIYACPHPECSDPPYTGDISGCGSHVCRLHLGHCVSCPYCADKKYYNADGWHRHMCEKHNNVPWYSDQIQAPPALAAASIPAVSVVSVSSWEEIEAPEDTLPHKETISEYDTMSPADKPAKPRPPTPSTEEIQQQADILSSDTRDYKYCTHSTHHPAAPIITSRYRRFDAPVDPQQVAQAIMTSAPPDIPESEPEESSTQRKCHKIDTSVQLEPTRSLKGQPHHEGDSDDDAPPSMA